MKSDDKEFAVRMTEQVPSYTLSQVRSLLQPTGISISTFYRLVREGHIDKYLPEGRIQDATYNKAKVDELVLYGTPAKRSKGEARQRAGGHTPPTVKEKETEGKVQVSLFEEEDQPAVYFMESELLTVKHTLPPTVIWSWQSKNHHVYWLLHDPASRTESKDIWGTLGVLPLREEVLLRVLHGEIRVQDIRATDVLPYESGQAYSCLVVSANVRPEKRPLFPQLFQSLLRYWSEGSYAIERLYAFASLSLEETFPLRLVREFGFMLRPDIAGPQPAWELRFDLWNPSPIIQQFAQYQKRQQVVTLLDKTYKRAKVPPAHYMTATTEEEIAATVDIDNEIFGISDIPRDQIIAVRQEWSRVEPESIQILRANNQVVGYHAMVPLPTEKILNILLEVDRPINIRQPDIYSFQPGRELDIYIIVTGLKQNLSEQEEGIYSASLMRGIMHQFEDLGRRGVVIRSVYGRSRTSEGIKRMEDMGFEELDFSPVHGKKLFKIDVATSDEPFIRPYKRALEVHL